MITSQAELLKILESVNIPFHLYEHPPVYTSDDAMIYCANIPGSHVKNLLVRNRKKTDYLLLTVQENKRVDLSTLGEILKLGRLSFANPHDLDNLLGVKPGSVTPFAIVNDHEARVKILFDDELLKNEYINIHPMINTATISLKLDDLLQFIQKHHQKKIEFITIPTIT
jgi:Ala-tRNA(Pro) deacylase